MLQSFGFTLVALLVIVDPFGTAVIFASMTAKDSAAHRRSQASPAWPRTPEAMQSRVDEGLAAIGGWDAVTACLGA